MVDEKDNRLPSVMREIIKNSDQYIEQMLIYDLIRRNHLDTYLRNNLRQIQTCLNKNKDKFIGTNEYTQAKTLFQEKETEYQSWTEKFGNQVRVKEEKLRLLEKAAEENRKKLEKEKEKEKSIQNEWNTKVQSNGASQEGNTRKKKQKNKRGKKNKGSRSTGGRAVVRKWVESHEPKTNTSMVSQSAWLTDEVPEKKKEHKKVDRGVEIPDTVRSSLRTFNVQVQGKKEPFQHLLHSKKLPLNPLTSDCFISNISFNFYDKENPQGGAKTASSSKFILDNLDRLFSPEKQNLVFDLGQELRPENLLPLPDDLSISDDDFLFPVDLNPSCHGLFNENFVAKDTMKYFLNKSSGKENTKELRQSMQQYFQALAPESPESFIRWILSNTPHDSVQMTVDYLIELNAVNPERMEQAMHFLCTNNPVELFNIHVLFSLGQNNINVPETLMNDFLGKWFKYCTREFSGEEEKRQKSKRKILAGFIANTSKEQSFDLRLWCREVDLFLSQNEGLSNYKRMKQAIDDRRKSYNKRRK
jgi:hypothetical protein